MFSGRAGDFDTVIKGLPFVHSLAIKKPAVVRGFGVVGFFMVRADTIVDGAESWPRRRAELRAHALVSTALRATPTGVDSHRHPGLDPGSH